MEQVSCTSAQYLNLNLSNLIKYFSILSVSFHDISSLFGFFTFLVIFSQLISGIMLALSLIPEPMLIPIVREEEDLEDLYTDDFFWLHERGVDLIFIFSYIHLFRKLYLNLFEYEHEAAWKSGVFTFLVFQVVVFCGLVLCCTHLSEITLTIAANILHTFFFFYGKFYWWVFTDKQLNCDTLIRLAYAHYLSAFYATYIAIFHGVDMHYDWKNETSYDGLDPELIWWDEALSNELTSTQVVMFTVICIFYLFYQDSECLSYEIFMWGDIGLAPDIRFYGVAPHWYFRPFMAWLIACPHHKTGIFGLLLFFFTLFHQVTLHGLSSNLFYSERSLLVIKKKLEKNNLHVTDYSNQELSLYFLICYVIFLSCCLYTTSFLPYGRFYNRLGGNNGMLFAYLYIFIYLSFYIFRRPYFLEFYSFFLYYKVDYLKNFLKKFFINKGN
uniref:cytochrome b n=1 Tax=Cryptocaryon irritans TaxID=153251 RepID=UPI0022FD9F23|nr:cytochrome b [Cryptocaryon irritans]WBP62335.1 cytochrome b [Cryptocaryon irritans]